ncbi:MAG: hypothetical protein KBE65_20410 [Phycisphaerae bacterium]|nr:hypothetical protein [Phycisphaerae bacterium]
MRREAFDAIEQMPGSWTLDTARQWFGREEWYLQVAAGCIFEHQAGCRESPDCNVDRAYLQARM